MSRCRTCWVGSHGLEIQRLPLLLCASAAGVCYAAIISILRQPIKVKSFLLKRTLCVLLGGGRFLKTALCVHEDGGLVVVKVPICDPLRACQTLK
jgi:hypothetical protein